jgi:hypothetical protein
MAAIPPQEWGPRRTRMAGPKGDPRRNKMAGITSALSVTRLTYPTLLYTLTTN